ncbi:MAG: LON peptidase substrate-binding domain-containing protein, partial [Allobaculum sp.]|nr:LON peptidase substrate-binding domain-containing protein [Allobaculum sp.]
MNTKTYPMICTRGVIVFPGQDLVIDVGRTNSLKAIENAQDNYNDRICMFAQENQESENPGLDDIYKVGVLCEIRHIRRFDKFLRVKFRGIERVRLKSFEEGNLSELVEVEMMPSEPQNQAEQVALMRLVSSAFEKMRPGEKFMSRDIMGDLSKGISPSTLSDKAAQIFPMSPERKQAYLETVGINDRLMMLLEDIEKEKQLTEVEKRINETVKERIDQNQKDFYLREKISALQDQLTDGSAPGKEGDQIRKRLQENPYPEVIKKKVLEELVRYENLPMASGETGTINTYIDWLLDVP